MVYDKLSDGKLCAPRERLLEGKDKSGRFLLDVCINSIISRFCCTISSFRTRFFVRPVLLVVLCFLVKYVSEENMRSRS